MKKIFESLKNLTPQQKIEFLESALEKKKNKKYKKRILILIKKAKQEQQLLEDTIKNFQKITPISEKKEDLLEALVEQESTLQAKKEEKSAQPYRTQTKQEDTYGLERLEAKYQSPEERTKEKYQSEPQGFSMTRFTEEERKKLKKQEEDTSRRAYHSKGE